MKYYYVQRLNSAERHVPGNAFGSLAGNRITDLLVQAGANVSLDFMGQFEFEEERVMFGAANRLAHMAHDLRVHSTPADAGEVHFVASEDQFRQQLADWQVWNQNPQAFLPTGFHEGWPRVVGWWALQEDLIWTREENVAENIRQAFVNVLDSVQAE